MSQEFTTKPYTILKGYRDANRILGVPYYTGKPNMGANDVNYTDGLNASVRVISSWSNVKMVKF